MRLLACISAPCLPPALAALQTLPALWQATCPPQPQVFSRRVLMLLLLSSS